MEAKNTFVSFRDILRVEGEMVVHLHEHGWHGMLLWSGYV
jgi:hypothetical protein